MSPKVRLRILPVALIAILLLIPAEASALGTFIVGSARTNWENAQLWAARAKATSEFVGLAPLYWQIAPTRGGVRPDVAYAQAAKETGYGRFGGVIDASFHNPCGMKITAGGSNSDPEAHQRFATWADGITACIDHLALYAGAPGYPRVDTPDPRHFAFLTGVAPTVEGLGGRWAPNPDYGNSIVRDFLNPMIGPQSGFDEWLLLLNPNNVTVATTISAEQTGKAPVVVGRSLPPLSRTTVLVDELISEGDVALRVTSAMPIVAERAMYFSTNGRDGAASGEGVASPQANWYLAEGYQSDDFDTYIEVYNPSAATASVTATFLLEGGGQIPISQSVAPASRWTIPAAGVAGLSGISFSTRVSSDQPVVVERSSYFKYRSPTGEVRKGGSASRGVESPMTSWDLAEGYSGDGFDTWVLVANPQATPVTVTETYLRDVGGPVVDAYTMPPFSRHTRLASTLPGNSGRSHSVHVDSSAPVAVERAEYYGYGDVSGGSSAQGAPGAQLKWYLAEGYTGPGFDTWVLISNPGSSAAEVTLHMLREGSTSVDTNLTIPAMSRSSVNLATHVGVAGVSTIVESTNGVAVVAERATYAHYVSARGWHAVGGSNSMGIATPSATWYFAEGYVY